jgi:hypothetical protein
MASVTGKQTLSLDAAEPRSGNLNLPHSTTQGSSFWARGPQAAPRSKKRRAVVLLEQDARHRGCSVDGRKAEDEGQRAHRGLPRPADRPSSNPNEVEGSNDRQRAGVSGLGAARRKSASRSPPAWGPRRGERKRLAAPRAPNGGRYRGRAAEKAHRTERGAAWTAASVKPRNAVIGRMAPRSKRGIRTIIIALGNVKNRNRSVWMGLIFR